jgi:hypothetical protein
MHCPADSHLMMALDSYTSTRLSVSSSQGIWPNGW